MGKHAPDPPDYSQLAAASEKSAQYAYEIAKRQQDWAEKVYNENKGISDQVIGKAMDALDKQTADADLARQRYKDLYQPLEDSLVKDAQDYNSSQRQETEAGKAEADVAAQFNSARQAAQDRLEAYGVDPSQTRSGALDLGTRVAEAAAQASAGNQARDNVEKTGMALRSEAVNVGRGYPGQIATSMAGAGNSGNQAVNTGLATTASGAQTMGTGAGWQGLGNSAIGTWGDVLNTGYNNQLDAWKANQQASSGWGSALGLVGGLFTGFEDGGIIPEEASPSGGAMTDDVPAQTDSGQPVRVNAGEFVIPEDVVKWMGEKGMQQLVMKARKEMEGGNGERPAQPEVKQAPQGVIPMGA